MPIKRQTTSETEGDLEARVRAAIKVAFPWLPDGAIKHQIKFSFTFGRSVFESDSAKARAEARLDILLEKDGKPLAVLELKRHNLPLSDSDEAQGLSYARVLEPPAPLVVVTNGTDVRLLETHTGKAWIPADEKEKAFAALIAQASRVAKNDIRLAIDSLMGTTPSVWIQAVRHVSMSTVNELTAKEDKSPLPFVRNFLVPRLATHELWKHIEAGEKVLVLEGGPGAGKSSVLRELTLRSAEQDGIATLYIEAGVGRGPLQALADALSHSLSWPVTPIEAREWLTRVSQNDGTRLVVAFDGVRPSDAPTVAEIEDLTSAVFGKSLCVIVAVDESMSDQLLKVANRRAPSVIGRRAKVIRVGQLDDFEFKLALQILERHRITFMRGAEMAAEYRTPSVLRTVVGKAMGALLGKKASQAISLPPLLGLREIGHVRARYAEEVDLRRMYRGLAKASLSEAQDISRPPELALRLLEECVIRRDTANKELESGDLKWLIENGFLRVGMSDVGGATVLVRLPELLASETARVLADEIMARSRIDVPDTANWIAGVASNLPLGEVVAAQAIVDTTTRPGGVQVGLLYHLVESRPEREVLSPSGRYATVLPGGAMVDITFEPNGKATVIIDGQRHEIDIDGEESTAFKNIHPWLILSHVASLPFVIERANGQERMDPGLLLTIGTCEMPLRSSRGPESMRIIPTLEFPGGISVVDSSAGIVEPITLGILDYISTEAEAEAEEWIEMALGSDSIPLLYRIHIALVTLVNFQTHTRSKWAEDILNNRVASRVRELIDASN